MLKAIIGALDANKSLIVCVFLQYRTVRNNGSWENQYEGVDSEDIDHDKVCFMLYKCL